MAGVEAALAPGTLPPDIAEIARNPAVVLDLIEEISGSGLPRSYTWFNRDHVRSMGLEAGLHAHLTANLSAYLNYARRSEPEIRNIRPDVLDLPPAHRFNFGVDGHFGIFQSGATVNYSGRSFWSDPLGGTFFGWTEPFTMVNATLSVELMDGQLKPSLRVVNLLDQDVRQHLLGTYIKRQIIAGVGYQF